MEKCKRQNHILLGGSHNFWYWFLPPFADITPLGMKVLGAFVGAVYGWLFMALTTPAASYTSALMFGESQMEKKQAYFQGFFHFVF